MKGWKTEQKKKAKESKEERKEGRKRGTQHTYSIKEKETIVNLINTCYTFCHIEFICLWFSLAFNYHSSSKSIIVPHNMMVIELVVIIVKRYRSAFRNFKTISKIEGTVGCGKISFKYFGRAMRVIWHFKTHLKIWQELTTWLWRTDIKEKKCIHAAKTPQNSCKTLDYLCNNCGLYGLFYMRGFCAHRI